MAKLIPDFESIMQKHQKPTKGEVELLLALRQHLMEDCEVYYQPYLNGDRPDIVIVRPGYGIHIIEVKDWTMISTKVVNGKWIVTRENRDVNIKSPLSQVCFYKEMLFTLHCSELHERVTENSKYFGLITCSVFFSKLSRQEIEDKITSKLDGVEAKWIQQKFIHLYGKELTEQQSIYGLIFFSRLRTPNPFFTSDIYDSLARLLNPPVHYAEEGKLITYTKEQAKLSDSYPNARQKIKGTAGSGKTMVLAKRAVNAYLRTKTKVLILTYNLTLINYIRDLLSDIREEYPWDAFSITNYHEFIRTATNKHDVLIESNECYDKDMFNDINTDVSRFETILIDEGQDYRKEWFKLLLDRFLTPEGEFVVFADEKQNIYGIPVDEEKKVSVPGISGRWNESLNKGFRFSDQIFQFVYQFQKETLAFKYGLDSVDSYYQSELDTNDSHIEYYPVQALEHSKIVDIVHNTLVKYHIHNSDAVVLNATIHFMQMLETEFVKKSWGTTTNFPDIDKLSLFATDANHYAQLHRSKKKFFFLKTGKIKLSTIHSFKGLESHTVFLLVEDNYHGESFVSDELLYTGMTRARKNLIIINLGNTIFNSVMVRMVENMKQPNVTIHGV